MAGQPPEDIEVLTEFIEGETSVLLGHDVVPREVPEVTGDEEARLHLGAQRAEIVEELVHGGMEV